MEEKVLLKKGSMHVSYSYTAHPEVVKMLEDTLWGSPGGNRYHHHDISWKIHKMSDPVFINLWRKTTLMGTGCLSRRLVNCKGEMVPAYYVRYFAIAPIFQLKGRSPDKIFGKPGEGSIRQMIHDILDNPKIVFPDTTSEKSIIYAYIDINNNRSREITDSFHFHELSKFFTMGFSRFFPKKKLQLTKVESGADSDFVKELTKTYENHLFYFTENVINTNTTYEYRQNGERLLGIQAGKVHWEIKELPGFSGKVIQNVVPSIPVFNRLYNPDKFQFTAFENFWVKKGSEDLIPKFLESVLAEEGRNTGMIWYDTRSPMGTLVLKTPSKGIFDKMKGNKKVDIAARFNGFDEKEVKEMLAKPVFLSAFDLT